MTRLHVSGKFPLPLDKRAVANEWKKRGYSCDEFVDPPGRTWTGFVHDCNELVTVIEGRLHMTIGDQECIAEPGDEIRIPKGALHSVRNSHPGVTRWLYGYD